MSPLHRSLLNAAVGATLALPGPVAAESVPTAAPDPAAANPAMTETAPASPAAEEEEPFLVPRTQYWYWSRGLGFQGLGNPVGTLTTPGRANVPGIPFPVPIPSQVPINLEASPSYAAQLAAGYQFDDARVELELLYGSSNLSTLTFGTPVNLATSVTARVSNYVATINGIYDFPTGTRFRPYVGAGLGAAYVVGSSGAVGTTGVNVIGPNNIVPAMRLRAGLEYELWPRRTIYLEPSLLVLAPFTTGSGPGAVAYDSLKAFNLILGIRFGI